MNAQEVMAEAHIDWTRERPQPNYPGVDRNDRVKGITRGQYLAFCRRYNLTPNDHTGLVLPGTDEPPF